MPDVRRIPVSTDSSGSPEGGNSAYLLADRGVLIDPGPPGEETWRRLRDGVEDAGLALTDVEHVLVTHWHADHTGAAPRLASEAEATLAMHDRDAPLLGDYRAARQRRLDRDAETLARWGVPQDRTDPLVEFDSRSPLPDTVPVRELADGETVEGVEVVHSPGHTAGHAAFVLDDEGFVGDAVLRTVTPNVGGGDTRQSDPLAAYRETLSRLDARVDTAHPGHGGAFDLSARTAELRAHHRERGVRVLDVLVSEEERGPLTPWDVATDLFGEMRGYHVKFGAGEAFAHLAHLEGNDVVERVGDDPLTFAVAGAVSDAQTAVERAWEQ
ncbi:MBL fold metallo-hydrolase [Haloarchaeobius amylolyticus]|uniref:MBL fold metallo-hydrolase n=1 Tax=Haloarchaeobius amylolyticus TaxID=1198296 RepID=UPI002270F1E0|nr:MBL fold metallo-hydrolase [Haloarchaeobius amylolyticus]